MKLIELIKTFFLEPKPVSILETIIVSVITMIIISSLKSIWTAISNLVIKLITDYVFKWIKQWIKHLMWIRRHRKLLKNGEIEAILYLQLAKKRENGKLSRLEKKAMDRAPDEVKEKGEALAKIDLNEFKKQIKDKNLF